LQVKFGKVFIGSLLFTSQHPIGGLWSCSVMWGGEQISGRREERRLLYVFLKNLQENPYTAENHVHSLSSQ